MLTCLSIFSCCLQEVWRGLCLRDFCDEPFTLPPDYDNRSENPCDEEYKERWMSDEEKAERAAEKRRAAEESPEERLELYKLDVRSIAEQAEDGAGRKVVGRAPRAGARSAPTRAAS